MNIYKKLLKNSGVFAIANLGSKLMTILLVPLYTYVLTTEEYGTIDMIITLVSLLLPLITLSIFDATLRFAVKSKYNKKEIFSSSISILIFGNIIFLMLYPLVKKVTILDGYIELFYLMVFFQTLNQVCAQFARGIGKVKVFALNGVINTVIMIVLNIILLVKFKMGIQGYLLSIINANIICSIYLIIAMKIPKYLSLKKYNHKLVKEMLIYSVPLIPNALMWWIMNTSDRYIITITLGIAANGIYAVAHKIPTILNLLYSIFSQAWQLSAIEEGESKNKSEFYTNVFNIFSLIMLIGTSVILIIIKPMIEMGVSENFKEAWKYVPFLLLAVVFTSFSAFLGTNYIAMKKTKGIFKTSVIGAILNIILNIILIPLIGINGASIATMFSFFVVWILRIYDTKDFVEIKLDIKKISLTIILILIQIICLYKFEKYDVIIQVIIFMSIILWNIKFIKELYSKVMVKREKIKGVDIVL